MLAVLLLSPVAAAQSAAPPSQAFMEGMQAYRQGKVDVAIENWRPLAEQGDARAQHNLGVIYHEGAGGVVDKELARSWWAKAAAQNYAPALHNLAAVYVGADGVPQDYARARELLEPAAARELAWEAEAWRMRLKLLGQRRLERRLHRHRHLHGVDHRGHHRHRDLRARAAVRGGDDGALRDDHGGWISLSRRRASGRWSRADAAADAT